MSSRNNILSCTNGSLGLLGPCRSKTVSKRGTAFIPSTDTRLIWQSKSSVKVPNSLFVSNLRIHLHCSWRTETQETQPAASEGCSCLCGKLVLGWLSHRLILSLAEYIVDICWYIIYFVKWAQSTQWHVHKVGLLLSLDHAQKPTGTCPKTWCNWQRDWVYGTTNPCHAPNNFARCDINMLRTVPVLCNFRFFKEPEYIWALCLDYLDSHSLFKLSSFPPPTFAALAIPSSKPGILACTPGWDVRLWALRPDLAHPVCSPVVSHRTWLNMVELWWLRVITLWLHEYCTYPCTS